MSFEKFHKMRTRPDRKPEISLQKTGRLGLNGGCLAEFIPDADFVHLYFDPKEKLIGLKPLGEKDKDADAYSLIKMRRSRGRFVQAIGFFKHHGIDLGKTRRFDPRWDDKAGLLVFDLKKPKE
ncbi:MAG: hypothetical protein NTW38_07415 [Candidatus Aminicenantes bacterium]|nr:hypothetical protein [Candidatus Aminicenantes bacterium]